MGNYSVPKEIRDLRPSGTIVKKQGKGYYVYKRVSTKVKVLQEDGTYKWKTHDEMGPCIGSITLEQGFIPNVVCAEEEEDTVLDYGNYAYSKLHSSKTYEELTALFNAKLATKIYLAGLIAFNEGFRYLKDMSRKYSESAACMFFPGESLGYEAIAKMYDDLGRQGKVVDEFEQRAINTSSHIVGIGGHVLACSSEKSELSEFGYKHAKLCSPQMNWLCAHDLEEDRPLASQFINGSMPDKSALQQLLSRFDFAHTHFYVDCGFNTESDKQLMSQSGSTYTVPMISGRSDHKTVYEKIKFDKRRWFMHDKNNYSSIIYYQEFPGPGKVRYIAYKDTTCEQAERKTYCENIKNGVQGYTELGLIESEKDFGLFILETTDQNTAQEIFSRHKDQMGIETYYNYVDSIKDCDALYPLYPQDDSKTQGVGFVVHIAECIFSEIKKELAEHDETVKNAIEELKGIKSVKENGRWTIRNLTKPRKTLADQLLFPTGKVLW